MNADPSVALSLAILVGAGSLGALWLIDLHEKEPFWALAAFLFLGATSAGAAAFALPPSIREESVVGVAATAEVCKALAIGAGIGVLMAARRIKGWFELNGMLDGVVYGAAAGLGFATGATFVSEIADAVSAASQPDQPAFSSVLGTVLLFALSEGAFGAVTGAAAARALEAPSRPRAVITAAGGLLLATALHTGYAAVLAEDSIYDARGLVGETTPLLVSLALLGALVVYAILMERQVIRGASASRPSPKPPERSSFVRGELDGWRRYRALKNRYAQLAMIGESLARAPNPSRRARLEAERKHLERSVEVLRTEGHAADVRLRRLGKPARRLGIAAAIALALTGGVAIVTAGAARERDRAEERRTTLAREAAHVRPVTASLSLLRDRLRQRLGRYGLVTAGDDEAALEEGATEAYLLHYRGGGAAVHHRVARFAGPEDARRWASGLSRQLEREGWEGDFSERSLTVLVRGDGWNVAWRNGRIVASFAAPARVAASFLRVVPY
jgi:RsiW-degrading membrane proteinase PrsW (M82 family)